MPTAILTEKLTKRYQNRVAVDALDLDVQRGEVFGFLGPNGAGKTTTIGMLLALVTPTSGRAEIFGHDLQRAPQAALQAVGAMIETPAFYPYLSGRDNLRALAIASGLRNPHVEQVLAVAGLADQANDRFRSYSLGMRQRLGIAAALLGDPHVLLLDEPTNGLDPAGQQEICTLIRTLAAGGRTVFLCSHMLHEVEQLCARVAILKHGQVVAEGTVAELLQRGRGLLVRVAADQPRAVALLRAQPWVASVSERGEALIVDAPVERAAEVNMLLAAQAVAVTEIRAHEVRLEEFFLDITQA